MHETVQLLLNHVRMVWRFRWWALSVAALVCVIGWTGVVLLPNQYEVTAKVFLDTTSMLKPLLRGLAADSRVQQDTTQMMRRTLLVRPNLEAVARKTDMDLKATSPESMEELLLGLAQNIRVSGTTRDNIFVIGYQNSDPKLANDVVEAILNLFVERSLGESRKDSGKTRQFLDRQIAEYESRLSAAEARVKDFKQNNVGMMPQAGQNYFTRLEQVRGQLSNAKLALDEATRRRDEYRRQIGGVDALFEAEVSTPAGATRIVHPLDARIANLESNLDSLLLQYTERHPDVINTREILADLVARRDADVEAAMAEMPPASADFDSTQVTNPIHGQITLALGAAEAEVAALQARVDEFSRREAELSKLVDTIPRIEAELARLNRDYDINRRNYDELVKRREALKLSEEASQSSDGLQFNIIEPPRVPLNPVGPNRPLFSSMVLVAGLGIGVGIAWLMGMVRPAFYSKAEVEDLFQIPVLGTVTRVWTRGELVRRRLEVTTFVLGCVVLIGMFSGLVTIELVRDDLLDKVRALDLAEKASRLVGGLI